MSEAQKRDLQLLALSIMNIGSAFGGFALFGATGDLSWAAGGVALSALAALAYP